MNSFLTTPKCYDSFAGASSVGQIMSILVKDKFLFTATSIPADTDATLSHAQLTEVMKVFCVEIHFLNIFYVRKRAYLKVTLMVYIKLLMCYRTCDRRHNIACDAPFPDPRILERVQL